MKLKTVTFFCSVSMSDRQRSILGLIAKLFAVAALAYIFYAPRAHANLDGKEWIFHLDGKEQRFQVLAQPRGNPLISLEEITKRFGLEISYNADNFQITLRNPKNKTSVALFTWSKRVSGWSFENELSRPIYFEKAKALVPIDFGDRVLRPLLTGEPPMAQKRYPKHTRLVIDPGHGGNDWGASVTLANGSVVHEKDLSLALALELQKELLKLGVECELTRDKDLFLNLAERTEVANHLKADLFISLHLNADLRKLGHGYEAYVLSLSNSEAAGRAAVARENMMIPEELDLGMDKALADLRAQANFEKSLDVAKSLSKTLAKTRKPFGAPIKMGPFYVLYGAEMPAVLIELGFLTHEDDRSFLASPEKHNALLAALAKDILTILNKEKKSP